MYHNKSKSQPKGRSNHGSFQLDHISAVPRVQGETARSYFLRIIDVINTKADSLSTELVCKDILLALFDTAATLLEQGAVQEAENLVRSNDFRVILRIGTTSKRSEAIYGPLMAGIASMSQTRESIIGAPTACGGNEYQTLMEKVEITNHLISLCCRAEVKTTPYCTIESKIRFAVASRLNIRERAHLINLFPNCHWWFPIDKWELKLPTNYFNEGLISPLDLDQNLERNFLTTNASNMQLPKSHISEIDSPEQQWNSTNDHDSTQRLSAIKTWERDVLEPVEKQVFQPLVVPSINYNNIRTI